MSATSFRWKYRVTYADCTLGNHVYYSRYLDLLEAARGEFFRHLNSSFLHWQQQDLTFPVIEVRLRYKAPARYDDALEIQLQPTLTGPVRLNFAYQVRHEEGAVILEAETFHAGASTDGKPKRLPTELVAKLNPYSGKGWL